MNPRSSPSGRIRGRVGGPRSVAAVGGDAKRMLGRTPGNIVYDPADEGRRHRRLHDDRRRCSSSSSRRLHNSRLFRPSRARARVRAGAARPDRRAPRDQGIGQIGRRARRLSDRRADGCRDRRRHPGCTRRAARWCSMSAAAPPRSRSSRSTASSIRSRCAHRRRSRLRRGDHQLRAAQPRHADR